MIERSTGLCSVSNEFSVSFDRRNKERYEKYSEKKPDLNMVSSDHRSSKCAKHEWEWDGENIQNGVFFEIERIEKMEKDKGKRDEEKWNWEK